MTRHFATYFDVNYAARGIAMVESLLHWSPLARITVLCLDREIEAILKAEFRDRVGTLSSAVLASCEPRLAALREERSPWEFYATQKPVFISRILKESPPGDLVAYIDSDTFFFSDPEPVFRELASASIAVSPHRFNDETKHESIHGLYNAGFGIWRNNATGRRCVDDWTGQCLAWCSCGAEGDGRFMNQGYLTDWPARYSNVSVITHPGVNLAPWNVGSHQLSHDSSGVLVDDQPLVFFHFSHLLHGPAGEWVTPYVNHAMRQRIVVEEIYQPYIVSLESISRRLIQQHGVHGLGTVRMLPANIPCVAYHGADGWQPMRPASMDDFRQAAAAILPEKFPVPVRRIDFGNPESGKFLISGWGQPETSWRWSDGSRAEIIFGLEEVTALGLDIQMRPLLIEGQAARQTVEISLNGQKLHTLNLTEYVMAIHTIPLPRELLRNNNTLLFEFPQATSPASLGLSTDMRKLGVQVEWMELRADDPQN